MIAVPFPPASLSGHNSGHWRAKSKTVRQYREWACIMTKQAKITAPATGDIRLRITFYPPDRRGDRTNFANRAKPIIDGVADALGVNDRRFLPEYHFGEPEQPGRVTIEVIP
jgi:crossover junction endodeoxyribonuclease RusA